MQDEIENVTHDSTKKISNPFSTGGGGFQFESQVQASFVVLMLADGYAPCMPCWPISKIKLQGKFAGYSTDDLIVFVKKEGEERKLLGQIKHSINITDNDPTFGDVIKAAWADFNNTSLFRKGKDAIALITGPLSEKDINDVRTILEWARCSENADEFFYKVQLANFSSKSKQNKLEAFRANIKEANNKTPVENEDLFEFLKNFHLLGYDLDIKAGVILPFVHTLIGQYSPDDVVNLWSRIIVEVQDTNKCAGTILKENLPEDVRSAFQKQISVSMPEKFFVKGVEQEQPEKSNWKQGLDIGSLVAANLVGGWNEQNKNDIEIIQKLTNKTYDAWVPAIKSILLKTGSPLSQKNGTWYIKDRRMLWENVVTKIFDDDLDKFVECAVEVLKERDPKFDLPAKDRWAAASYGKSLRFSLEIRKGIAESLALIAAHPEALIKCSKTKAIDLPRVVLRKIFENVDANLWGSLDNLLPVLAEAAPREFLSVVETELKKSPCPFWELFSQEENSLFGQNYLNGLFRALEVLAWDPEYIVRVCMILGELSNYNGWRKSSIRPLNSLIEILLPWYPQTVATIEKRQVVIKTLIMESPNIAWELLIALLPNQAQVSTGTSKPVWRKTIPDDHKVEVSKEEYFKQVTFLAEEAFAISKSNIEKLEQLIGYMDDLPSPVFDKILEYLGSNTVCGKPESERIGIWDSLTDLIIKHRRFSDAQWAMNSETVSKIENVAAKLAPVDPLNLYRRLFNHEDYELYEENGNWQEQRQKLEEDRNLAINKILDKGSLDAVICFAEKVKFPFKVGFTLGIIAIDETDQLILPLFLINEKKELEDLAGGYVRGRQSKQGWLWVDGLKKMKWTHSQIARLFTNLPFEEENWNRVQALLESDEREYWLKTDIRPYEKDCDYGKAVSKLIQYQRPYAAIYCLYQMLLEKRILDSSQCIEALNAAISSTETSYLANAYNIVKIIQYLQNDPKIERDKICQIEWAYLPLLEGAHGATPKFLEENLAANPSFFCEVISIVYRSTIDTSSHDDLDENKKAIALNAWKLLNGWKFVPGKLTDGQFSEEAFKKWIQFVRDKAESSGHLEVALLHIGMVLVYGPPDEGGLWINKTIAS